MTTQTDRSRLALALCLAALCAAWWTSPARAASLSRQDKGLIVARLQRLLQLKPDGLFGVGTVAAVELFQRHHHLTADGRVGTQTWRLLERAAGRRRAWAPGRPHATSRRAHRLVDRRPRRGHARTRARARAGRPAPSRGVRLLQRGLGMRADGIFGATTAAAVRRFQARHGLGADAVVGAATWAALGIHGRHAVLTPAGVAVARHHRNGQPLRISWSIGAANRIARLPYRFGGGHGSFATLASNGLDCSGSVSYVLHAARALDAPLDSSQLASYGLPGPGRWITVYANPGHAFMTIDGRRFDTSGQSASGSRWQPRARAANGYVLRHPPGL